MNDLKLLESRIKGARLYKLQQANKERLYIPYGRHRRNIKITVWFEVVNDHLKPFVRVENYRHPNSSDHDLEYRYRTDIERQFHEIIMDCELERKNVPLHERLKDHIIPVYKDSLQHQADALRFCCSMKVTALFADISTGKTKIVIDLCRSRYEAKQIRKVLVFCPVSIKKNFREEIEKWDHHSGLIWKILGIESISRSNRIILEALDFVDNETQIIIDESHMVKSPFAKRSKWIKMCCDRTSYKIVMTGTPVTENIHNLYMQYAMLSDLIIGVHNWQTFGKKYLIFGGISGDEIIGYKNIDHLMGLLEPYTYQISKEECLDLPAKKELSYTCGFTCEQDYYYQAEKERLLDLIQYAEVKATDIFKVFIHMQQIVSGYYRKGNGEIKTLKSNKLNLLKKVNLEEKTLFFCKYMYEVDLLIDYFGRNKCALFTGRNPKERNDELRSFVDGDKQYFIATMQSGGTGLNGLQTASRQLVFFSNSFSYFQRKQSIGRIDRQGQKRKMIIIDFLTDSGIDRRIMQNLRRKGNLADEIRELLRNRTKLKQYVEEL
jgi:SNF2 family DNA or RNA helicase